MVSNFCCILCENIRRGCVVFLLVCCGLATGSVSAFQGEATDAASNYKNLLTLFQQREYGQVVAQVEQLAIQEPLTALDLQSMYLGAESHFAIGNYDRAKEFFEFWLSHSQQVAIPQTSQLMPYCKFRLAQTLDKLNQSSAAIGILRELSLEALPGSLRASTDLQLAWLLAESNGESHEAKSLCEQCLVNAPEGSHDRLSAMLLMAVLAQQRKEYQAASDLLIEVRSKCNETKELQQLRYKATVILLQINNTTRESTLNASLLEELKRSTPPTQKLYEMGKLECLFALDDSEFEPAELIELTTLAMNATEPEVRERALVKLVRLPEKLSTDQQRSDWCKRLADQGGLSPALQAEVAVRFAKSLRGQGKLAESVDVLQQSIKVLQPADPWYPATLLLLAESSYQVEEFTMAKDYFAKVLRDSIEDSSEVRYLATLRLGEVAAIENDWTLADQFAIDLRNATDQFSYAAATSYLFGRIAVAKGEIDEARKNLQRAIETATSKEDEIAARSQWLIGETYMLQNQYDKAVASYQSVLSYQDQDQWCALAYLQTAKCYEQREEWPAAIAAYESMIVKHPDSIHLAEAKERLLAAKEVLTPRIAEKNAVDAR